MQQYELNSGLLNNLMDFGTYETLLDARYVFDDWQIDDDFKNGDRQYNSEFFWNNFDNQAFKARIIKTAQQKYNGDWNIKGIAIKIEMANEMISPREYNFSTDTIGVLLSVNPEDVLKYAKQHKTEFDKFLNENYSSYDGFISFTPNNYWYWLNEFENDNVQSVAAFFNFLFADFSLNEYDSSIDRDNNFGDFPNYVDFIESFDQDLSYNEFITQDAYNKLQTA